MTAVGEREIRTHPRMSAGSRPPGEIFAFVDECHRAQSGKLHKAMKAILPGSTLIGFTGTPHSGRSGGNLSLVFLQPGR